MTKKKIKFYSIIDTAKILGVTRQTIYYWIKKKWIQKPGKDYKGDLVFTKGEVKKLVKWKNSVNREG